MGNDKAKMTLDPVKLDDAKHVPFAPASDPSIATVDSLHEPTVAMKFEKRITLTMQNGKRIVFEKGVQSVPESLVDHYYLKANGVTLWEPPKPVAVDPRFVHLAFDLYEDGVLEKFAAYIGDGKALAAQFAVAPPEFDRAALNPRQNSATPPVPPANNAIGDPPKCPAIDQEKNATCDLPDGHHGDHQFVPVPQDGKDDKGKGKAKGK